MIGNLQPAYSMSQAARSTHNAAIRCAIYTRKSTEEGLDQEFNSLDAQRESAEAYIASQRHEGWSCLPEHYDDGGFTGGNMQRPALERLCADIEAGQVDCVVVYKVDRLSRSLLDFARIMELFDRHKVSFVSVTQQFNTTSSMGRLTLNILFSFAQFERELISERVKDKMSAARRKGKWVGGPPSLGYDVAPEGGKLIVNADEAAQVRAIYDLYLEHQAAFPVVQELNRRGWVTKHWVTKKGRELGGKTFTKNALYRILTNVLYVGKVRFEGMLYEGEHDAIVDADVWQQVQERLRRNGLSGGRKVRNKHGALLKGLLYCTPCESSMVHAYTRKREKRYRYYVYRNAQQRGWSSCPSKALNAHEIETPVVEHIRGVGRNEEIVQATVKGVREQSDRRMTELEVERRRQESELKQLYSSVEKLVHGAGSESSNGRSTTDQLADLQDRIRASEQRITAIREEVIALERETVGESELTQALAHFDPVWESLSPRERARIIRLLIERVGYDGRDGRVTVAFRSVGIKALCSEGDIAGKEATT